MTKETFRLINRLTALGISESDAWALRRIAMTLHRWHELECGTDNGCVERDEKTGRTYWLNSYSGKRSPFPDREMGARKRLDAIMAGYAFLAPYIQGDPRGAALFILKPGDVPVGGAINSYYSRGVAVYQ